MYIQERYHVSYCTNIHPGENWAVTFEELQENLPAIKKRFTPDNDFGVGLRLSNLASEELNQEGHLAEFKDWLHQNGCYVYTLNGFPYGNFHGQRVKENVHAPDWTQQQRLAYTLRLFNQLAYLKPRGMEGGISTSPVSYKHWHKGNEKTVGALRRGAHHMVQVALRLYELEQTTQQYMHLDIEPEPDGLLENTTEVLVFYEEYLVPAAQKAFGKMGVNAKEAETLLKRYVTICYDICHFSLAYEEPATTFSQLADAGIRIGKIQISAALKILARKNGNTALWETLRGFDEPTYLHQVTEKIGQGVHTYSDLREVLDHEKPFTELRAHFHVPVFLRDFGLLQSTQDHIIKTLDFLKSHPSLTQHLEVETYTWEVLPAALKIPLQESITRELEWVKNQLL